MVNEEALLDALKSWIKVQRRLFADNSLLAYISPQVNGFQAELVVYNQSNIAHPRLKNNLDFFSNAVALIGTLLAGWVGSIVHLPNRAGLQARTAMP